MKVLNEKNFDDAIKNEKLVVVDFWLSGACRARC